MHELNYQDLFARVSMPTRYAGNEINSIKKDLERADLKFGLVFPDLYEIGTSHFGLQILYSILNDQDNIAAERFFSPAPDMERYLSEKKIPCLSMESRKELESFDVIGISLPYELNFTNILTMFSLSGIPFYSDRRKNCFPLVIGGGPCAFNPEPLSDFFDAFVIGDGEEVVLEISRQIIRFKKQGDGQKQTLLRLLSKIRGVYIPSFFEPEYDESGIQTLRPLYEDYTSVKRAFLPELDYDNFPDAPIVPFGKPVHDRLRIEIARGCSRGCRFCQAGMIYRPVRERSLETLVEITRASLEKTGYSDISLLSLSTGDYSDLEGLMENLLDLNEGHCNAISLPSIRAERLTPALMNIIRKVKKTGFTIAPEAGSQRLRNIINKNLTDQDIFSAVENAFRLGWRNIKLYFMTGLPFETPEDIEDLCRLSRQLGSTCARGRKTVNINVSAFIPKSHTPFQRCSQSLPEETMEKLNYIRGSLRHPRIKLKWQSPEMNLVEGVWARGDRKLSSLLVKAFEKGCRLDGWTEEFNFRLWEDAFSETGIDPEFYTLRRRDENEVLPWDHIESGILPEFLKKEFEKAKDRSLTYDCRENKCNGCGICDFERIKPVLHDKKAASEAKRESRDFIQPNEAFRKVRVFFSKLEQARFFSHLELVSIIQRAIKRAGIVVKYSEGFNPLMKLSFENSLPVGMESQEESFFIHVEKTVNHESIPENLNAHLPEGLRVLGCMPSDGPGKDDLSYYRITLKKACFEKEEIARFFQLSEFVFEDTDKRGRKRAVDLRKSVEDIFFIDPWRIEMVLRKYNERILRPSVILTNCLKLNKEIIITARIKKIKRVS